MTFRRQVVQYASRLIGPLLCATGALLAFVIGLSVLFFAVHRSEVLFVIEAETSRFEYTVMHAERIEIPVRGVRVITNNSQVVTDAPPTAGDPANCYSGVLLPTQGSNVVFRMDEGLQHIKLSPAPDANDRPVARLTQSDASYRVGDEQTDVTAMLLANDDEPAGGFLAVHGLTTLTQDPACAGSDLPFALPEEPVAIDGHGFIGRGFLPATDRIDPSMRALDLEYISGEIDIVMRESICFVRLRGQSCKNIFRLESDPVPIPSSSALHGEGPDGPTPMIGQAFFKDGRYVVQVSTNAQKLVIDQPSPFNWEATQRSLLGVSLLDRILIEPLLIVSVSAFFTLLGITLGVLQIEVHEDYGNDQNPATSDNKTAEGKTEPIGEAEEQTSKTEPPES